MERAVGRIWFWEEAPFLRVLPPLILAIIVYDWGWCRWNVTGVSITALVLLCLFTATSRFRTLNSYIVLLRFFLLQFAVFFVGLISCQTADVTVRPDWLGYHVDSTSRYVGQLLGAPEEKSKTWKLVVSVEGRTTDKGYQPLSGKALVYIYKHTAMPALKRGDRILLPPFWQPIESNNTPFAFDFKKYAARNGLFHQQFVSADQIYLWQRVEQNHISWIDNAHNWCMEQLARYLHDTATLGIMQAMIVGDEVNLDPELRQAYSETGIIHVVAISGGHVMMLFSIVSACFFWLRKKQYQWIKYVVALPIVWFYVLISGAPPSAIRSVIMFSVLAFGVSMDKEHNALNQLFATAFILLCVEPMWLYSVGFQLSFVAVLSLILFYKPICNWLPLTNKVARALWQAAAASIAAEILVAPIVVYYFHLFPLGFILANVVAWLLMGLVLVAGLLLILISWLPWLAEGIATGISFAVTWFNEVIYLLQLVNPDAFRHLVLTPLTLVLLYLIIVCGAIFFLIKQLRVCLIGLALLCTFVGLLCWDEWNTLRQHRLVFFRSGEQIIAERIVGKYYERADTAMGTSNQLALSSVHIGYRAWRKKSVPFHGVYDINGHSVLVLQNSFPQYDTCFPIHTLVVTAALEQFSVQSVCNLFLPKRMIVLGKQKKEMVERWSTYCAQQGIVFWDYRAQSIVVLDE